MKSILQHLESNYIVENLNNVKPAKIKYKGTGRDPMHVLNSYSAENATAVIAFKSATLNINGG